MCVLREEGRDLGTVEKTVPPVDVHNPSEVKNALDDFVRQVRAPVHVWRTSASW
jgi:hypothetical protein